MRMEQSDSSVKKSPFQTNRHGVALKGMLERYFK